MEGTNHRIILKSDSSQSGGFAQLNYDCLPEPITDVTEMAQARLTGRFKPSDAKDYGCAGRGDFNVFSQTVGKAIDETDKAFYSWKKCTQCALSVDGVTPFTTSRGIPSYQYDLDTDSCSESLSTTGRQVCECDKKLINFLIDADNNNTGCLYATLEEEKPLR